jgi:hypothetical protein
MNFTILYMRDTNEKKSPFIILSLILTTLKGSKNGTQTTMGYPTHGRFIHLNGDHRDTDVFPLGFGFEQNRARVARLGDGHRCGLARCDQLVWF